MKEDEEVCQIETDKTSIPVKAPFAGVIAEFFVEDGSTVKAGENLFSMKPAGNRLDYHAQYTIFNHVLFRCCWCCCP